MQKCPAVGAPGTSIKEGLSYYGFDEGGFVRAFRSVSPSLVTGAPLVGESLLTLCPSVE
jgi:hypothetical protein